MAKTFVLIANKQYEISPYIKDWADKTVRALEFEGFPADGIKKVIEGTIITKEHLHNYCTTRNLCFNTISKIVFN